MSSKSKNTVKSAAIATVKSADGKQPIPAAVEAGTDKKTGVGNPTAAEDPVFAKYGEPFITNGKGKVKMNQCAVAVKCASEHVVKYDPTLKRYERYDKEAGRWTAIHEVEVLRLLGDLLRRLGDEWDQQEFVKLLKTSDLASTAKMLQPYQAEVVSESPIGLVHTANGVLDLRGKKPALLPHDLKYPFKFSAGIRYDPEATCPNFTEKLLGAALEAEDIDLAQKYYGSMLLGPNTCHGILLIRGTAGGGKSTLTSIVEMVLGEELVAQLRTKHLNGRFETSAFIGRRVLVGKDVPGDTLAENGARLLKSLVGGDLLQAEIKYNPTKQAIRGDYHVVIVSNNNLRIALDGDEEAWRRRLLIVDFENEKPGKPIPDFAAKLVAEEGSGILNWLVEGALAYREEMSKNGTLRLTEKQQQRVATLLHDSDSVLSFVEDRVIGRDGADVSSEELLLGYYGLCKQRHWKPVAGHQFQTRLPDLLCEKFHICRRNDIKREEKAVRGYKGLALN